MVEVDSSYYAILSVANAQRWVERTPDYFVFHVKAFRLFTGHWAQPEGFPTDLRPCVINSAGERRRIYLKNLSSPIKEAMRERFEDSLLPLDSAGKLGVVLFQFAP